MKTEEYKYIFNCRKMFRQNNYKGQLKRARGKDRESSKRRNEEIPLVSPQRCQRFPPLFCMPVATRCQQAACRGIEASDQSKFNGGISRTAATRAVDRVNDRFVFHDGSKPREQWRTRIAGIPRDFNGLFPTDQIRIDRFFSQSRLIIFVFAQTNVVSIATTKKKKRDEPRSWKKRETPFSRSNGF